MEKLTIGITTFPRRFEQLKNLIHKIRQQTLDEIIIQINQFNKIKDDEYRKSILSFCSSMENVYLTIYPTFTSLAKMWNTIVINASNENVLILNDDVDIYSNNILNDVVNITKSYSGLTILNNSWSHFVISKLMLNELNYFDERFLAYGEEDGDMVWRYVKKFGTLPQSYNISGILNLEEGYNIIPINLKWFNAGHVIRPIFNRNFCLGEKYKQVNSGISGMFGVGHECVINNEIQYPYEKFKMDNEKLL